MVEELLKAVPVFLASMLKFILGPMMGFAAGLHFVTTVLVTIASMMVVVVAFTYFGEWIKTHVVERFIKKKNKPAKKRSDFWHKYGLTGIAFFTPVFLTPIGGTILALSMGNPRRKILFYMLISAIAWAFIFSWIVYFVGKEVLEVFPGFIK
ncbi:MAG: small multi-drug export protein [Bacteroidota bacterium]